MDIKKFFIMFSFLSLQSAEEFTVFNLDTDGPENPKKQKIEDKDFYCLYCAKDIEGKKEFDLNYHLENTHSICLMCLEQFKQPQDVRWHKMKHFNDSK